MIKREVVSSWQMATLFLAFMTGSAIVNIPSPMTGAARNAAWLSLWIANGSAMLLLSCVYYLHRKYPEMTLIETSRKVIGRTAAVVIAVPLMFAMFLMLANIVVDIGVFFKSTMMRETPSYVIHVAILLVASLTVKAGIEVMARMFTLLLIMMFVFSLLVMLFAMPSYSLENLLPLFPEGYKPVFHGIYHAWGFPYAEIVVFSLLLPYVRRDIEPLGKLLAMALLVNGLSLSAVIVCTILALGPLAGEVKYSLFVLARLIEVREIVERVESVIGMALIVGSYMKAAIVMFAINQGLTRLLRLQDDRILIYPVGTLILMLSLTMYRNELEFGEIVSIIWPLCITMTGVAPVLLVALVSVIKVRGQGG